MKTNLNNWKCIKFIFSSVAFLTSLMGCTTDLDDVNARLDNLEQDVTNLQSAVSKLQAAYDNNLFVSKISPLTSDEGGWSLIFADGSSINIRNGIDGSDGTDGADGIDGKDGITPILMIDQDGNWAVSYDNGSTFTALLDDDGNKISAVGKDGVDGIDGTDGTDGADGKDGEDGISVRVAVNDDGYYVLQTYKVSDPDTVLSETITPYTANTEHIISSIIQDDYTHHITITLADGKSYTFNMTYVTPTSIALLSVNKTIELTNCASGEIEFRVNPSNAKFDYDITSSSCEIELDCLGSATRSSYTTAPKYYKLSNVEQVYNESGEMKVGQYKARITDNGYFTSYDDAVALVLNVTDGNGDAIQISSSAFRVTWIADGGVKTGLPIVYIDTPNSVAITSKEDWTADVKMKILDCKDGKYSVDYEGSMSMKGRGNSTWKYPKKPYGLKLDSKSKILGMKKYKRWVLLANWMDRTLIRNAVAFEIARRTTGLDWTPSGKFVEVVLNGEHIGNYWLCEQIKVDGNRVNITELDEAATSGDGITGGYIFELDTYYDETYKFKSSEFNYPWQFKDPDEVNDAQFNYVQDYVTKMEQTLTDATKFANREFVNYMDLDSFVDWWFVYELSMNGEPGWPKSSYMHKDVDSKDGRMKAGPVWDFDWGTFLPSSTSSYNVKTALYYKKLFNDNEFRQLVKTRWNAQKANFQAIADSYIDGLKEQLTESDKLNSALWPISTTDNGDEGMTFSEAVDRLKTAYQSKLNWLDAAINAY